MAQYADIIEITAPSKAVAGSTVYVTVKIKNLYSSTIGIMVGGALEYGVSPWPSITFPANQVDVVGGVTHPFAGYFTMPNKSVIIHAYSYYYGVDGAWHWDDEQEKTVSLSVVEVGWVEVGSLEFTLTPSAIVGGWVEVGSIEFTLTPSAVPPPTCSVDADCPEGYVCRNGVCTLAPTCLVDADCPEGYVCEDGKCVKKEPTPGISGVIVGFGFWDGKAWQTKPASVELGSIIGVSAIGRNTGDPLASMTMNAIIKDPARKQIATATKTVDWVGTGGEIVIECKTSLPADTQVEGNYTAYIELIGREGGAHVLDTWEDKIGTVGKPFPWKYVGIGLGALGAILLVPKKKKK